jgi:hypothetical protein
VVTAVAIAAVAAWLLVAVWRSPHRGDLATYGAYVAAVVGLAGSVIRWAWRAADGQRAEMAGPAGLDRPADLLAVAVGEQWSRAAANLGLLVPEPIPVRWGQPSASLAGPVSAAVRSTRFAPLSGLPAVTRQRLMAGGIREDLLAVYGGLGSGRLIITGKPGSGKSGAAVLLLLAALRHRQQVSDADQRRVPVPVLFTMHGWDPRSQQVGAWLSERLAQTYQSLAGKDGAARAARLLAAGRLAVILDGLDEISAALRPVALRALSQQATFRLVILARTTEMAGAAAKSLLDGAAAIELRDIDPADAAGYLASVQRDPPPRGWQELITRLRQNPDSSLARALATPLTISLVRDTYRLEEDISELLSLSNGLGRPAQPDDIVDHLLDRVVPASYSPRPGEPRPRYDLATAERALRYLATKMNQDGTRDLLWWRIPAWQPASGPLAWLGGFLRRGLTSRSSAVATALTWGVVLGLTAGLAGAYQAGSRVRPDVGFTAGLVLALCLFMTLVTWLIQKILRLAARRVARTGRWGPLRLAQPGPDPPAPRQVTRADPVPVFRPQVLAFCLGIGLAAWPLAGPVWAAVLALATLAGSAITFGPASGEASPLSPLAAWRSDRLAVLVLFLVGFLFFGVIAVEHGLGAAAVYAGTGIVLTAVVVLPQSAAWRAATAFVRLAWHGHTPLRLLRFLEDARERQVLRAVGPVYQFRHARLQDRMASEGFRADSE